MSKPRPQARRLTISDLEKIPVPPTPKERIAQLTARVAELEAQLKDPGFKPAPSHESLFRILLKAYDQAAGGKGRERHANDLPFGAQPMQGIGFLLHSSEGMLYQSMKKIQEANSVLERGRRSQIPEEVAAGKRFAERELLGAIVYTAGALLFEEAH